MTPHPPQLSGLLYLLMQLPAQHRRPDPGVSHPPSHPLPLEPAPLEAPPLDPLALPPLLDVPPDPELLAPEPPPLDDDELASSVAASVDASAPVPTVAPPQAAPTDPMAQSAVPTAKSFFICLTSLEFLVSP